MFRRLKRALDNALSGLESRSTTSEEDVDRLLAAMREELVETKARMPELERMARDFERRRDGELKRAADCVRRADQARAIDDEETLRVALEFGEKHNSRAEVFEQKREAAVAELELKRVEVAEMTRQLKKARTERSALVARARRTRTGERLRGASDGATGAFDRFEERLTRDEDLAAAEEEVERALGEDEAELDDFADLDAADYDLEGDELLDKLKRRMGEDDV